MELIRLRGRIATKDKGVELFERIQNCFEIGIVEAL